MTDETVNDNTPDRRADLLHRAATLGISVHPNAKEETIAAKIEAALKTEDSPAPSEDLKKSQTALTRVIITSNDPQKSDQSGDIIRVSNKNTGSVAFYFPFGKPWHVPEIVLNTIKEKTFFLHGSRKDGREVVARNVPAYNVQVLPSLTEKELERIAAKQAAMAAGG